MPIVFETKIQGATELAAKFSKFPKWTPQIVEQNFRTLGVKTTRIMQHVLEPVKYKGHLANSVSSEIDVNAMTLAVGPTAKEAGYVFYGTRPHWAPIEPLKEWARWKLGDEGAAYAVRFNIAQFGTNSYLRRGVPGAWSSPFGDGLDYLRLVTERGDFKSNVTATAKRIGSDLAAKVRE